MSRILCVDHNNGNLSETAAAVLGGKACGLDPRTSLWPITAEMLSWCEEIVCFDKQTELSIHGMKTYCGQKIRVLNIHDVFEFMEGPLVDQIKKRHIDGE